MDPESTHYYSTMPYPNITTLTSPPKVGSRYLVPCVQIPVAIGTPDCREGSWIPVLGPAHRDPELGVTELHFHTDFRFISSRRLNPLLLNTEEKAPVYMIHVGAILGIRRSTGGYWPQEDTPVVYREMKCHRAWYWMPDQFHDHLAKEWGSLPTTCGRCPHRGTPLGSLVREPGGIVTCPSHGLRVNVEARHAV